MDTSKIVKKARLGEFESGYVQQAGFRNQWVIIYPNGDLYRAPENNMMSAFEEARYLYEAE